MKDYEAMCAFKANLPEEKVNALIARFEKKIADAGGEFVKAEKLGQRKFPFRLKKHKNDKEGLFVLIKFKGEGRTATILRDDFRVQEDIVRHMITVAPEEEEALIEEAEIAQPKAAGEEISGQPQ